MKRYYLQLIILILVVLSLVACTAPAPTTSPLALPPTSPIQTPISTTIVASATPSPKPTKTLSPPPTTTPPPTKTITPIPTPTLTDDAFVPQTVAEMAIWQQVENEASYPLYQISQTPLGVTSLQWSPDGQNLWLNVVSGPTDYMFPPTIAMVANRNTRTGHATGNGDFRCYPTHDWSPDGKQLAYIKEQQLWLADADGQNPRLQPSPDGIESVGAPHFSPDGKMIVVDTFRAGDNASYQVAIWILDTTTGIFKHLIDDVSYGELAWSPSGDALAFIGIDKTQHRDSQFGAWIVKLDNGQAHFAGLAPLPGTEGYCGYPTWLPSGQKILVTLFRTSGVWLMDMKGNAEALSNPKQPMGPCDSAVASSDGRYVVYTVNGDDLYAIDLMTENVFSLGKGDLCNAGTSIIWSPITSHFLRWGDNLPLDLIDATNHSTQTLSPDGLWPTWSPDGQYITYWRYEPGGYTLCLLNLDDLQITHLTAYSSDEFLQYQPNHSITPQWSPNGDAIAFVSYRDKHPEAYMLSLVDN